MARGAAAALALLVSPVVAAAAPAIDLFRAMRAVDVRDGFGQQDDDVADIGGVIKYIQTETIAEHALGPPYRRARKYGIDCIRRNRYKIQNPASLLTSRQVLLSEFGQFEAFDEGVATALAQTPVIRRFGDWVGIQIGCSDPVSNCDPRFPSDVPYFWFSLGNFCPNLPWVQKGTRQSPNSTCLKDTEGKYILGGQCPGGFDVKHRWPAVEPTGHKGCTYSYGRSEIVLIDELVGITGEDCGGRNCVDFADFRYNCTNGAYRRQFLAPHGRELNTTFCVEYDIHPACNTCSAKECQDLIRQGRTIELGIPFWRGRCDARANVGRMEALAAAFDIPGAASDHRLVDSEILGLDLPCLRKDVTTPQACSPVFAGRSGPYCSRSFSGVCQTCFIFGTVGGPDVPIKPRCPFDIFNTTDYRDRARFPAPQCRTRRARDECCLYAGTCDGTSDPQRASLDDDGLALVAARRSTPDMAAFLRRALMAEDGWAAASSAAALFPVAHREWGPAPTGRSLVEALRAARWGKADVSYRALPRVAMHEGRPVGEHTDRRYSLAECEGFCTANPECHSFAYEPKGLGYCYLKDRWLNAKSELVSSSAKNSEFRTYYQVAASDSTAGAARAKPLLDVVPTPPAEDDGKKTQPKNGTHKNGGRIGEKKAGRNASAAEAGPLQTNATRGNVSVVEDLRQNALNATSRAEKEAKVIGARLVKCARAVASEVEVVVARLLTYVGTARVNGWTLLAAFAAGILTTLVAGAAVRRRRMHSAPESKAPDGGAPVGPPEPSSPGAPGGLSPSRRRLLVAPFSPTGSERTVVRTLTVV